MTRDEHARTLNANVSKHWPHRQKTEHKGNADRWHYIIQAGQQCQEKLSDCEDRLLCAQHPFLSISERPWAKEGSKKWKEASLAQVEKVISAPRRSSHPLSRMRHQQSQNLCNGVNHSQIKYTESIQPARSISRVRYKNDTYYLLKKTMMTPINCSYCSYLFYRDNSCNVSSSHGI